MTLTEKRIQLYLARMRADGVIPKGGRHLGCCPSCGSGDVTWCGISVRPYCRECDWWGAVNFGSADDALDDLRRAQSANCVSEATI